MNKISNIETADLCRELALLLHAGITTGDGLYLLAEEETEAFRKEMLTQMAKTVDFGSPLAKAFEDTKIFPVHMTGLLQVGEAVGRTEETLNALSRYYENKENLERRIINSLTYPVMLLLLMLVVIVVLLTKVLPVFNEVYASLGGSLTGIAGALLSFGTVLNNMLPLLCTVLGLVLVLVGAFTFNQNFRTKVLGFWNNRFGDKGVSKKLNNARFAQALSMGISSGMPAEDAVDMATVLLGDIPKAAERCEKCAELLKNGESLSKSLNETELMEPAACRLLTLGMRGGSGDTVMEELARRMQNDAEYELERTASKIEPALVLVTTVLVGAILLAVMLPLMNIMTAIG